MPGPLSVSTSAVSITPPPGYPMGGYGVDTPRRATGTNEPLMARCTILWDAGVPKVIVTADVLAFGRRLHRSVRRRVVALGIASADFVLTATHTHNGPVLLEKLDPFIAYGITDLAEVRGFSNSLVDDLVVLVTTTLGAPQTECTLEYQVTDENFSFNREGLPYVEVDVPVLLARALDGTPRAVLFGYGAHPVAAGGQTEFDPDYPAQAIKEIEAIDGTTFAQFLLGPAGDQNPAPAGTFEASDAYGRDLGLTVAGAIEHEGRRLTGPILTAYDEVAVPLDVAALLADPAAARAAFAARAQRPDLIGYFRRHAEEMLRLLDAGALRAQVPLPVQVWKIGGDPGLQIVFCGGEVVAGYAAVLRSRYGGSEGLWFNGYSNEIPAYIPSDELISRPSYAGGVDMDAPAIGGGSMTVYRHPAHFVRKAGPGSPDGVEQVVLGKIQSMLSPAG